MEKLAFFLRKRDEKSSLYLSILSEISGDELDRVLFNNEFYKSLTTYELPALAGCNLSNMGKVFPHIELIRKIYPEDRAKILRNLSFLDEALLNEFVLNLPAW